MEPNLKFASEQKKALILLKFTGELIRNSGGEIIRLENVLDEKSEEKDEKREESRKLTEVLKKPLEKEIKEDISSGQTNEIFRQFLKQHAEKNRKVLRIPEPKIPRQFQYLKPSSANAEIDLGKLNSLIKDPLVKLIECNGPNKNVLVIGNFGIKNTGIFLDKNEINDIIKKFSVETKIPVHEGVFNVIFGKLIFSAIVSEVIGSKFIIKKMTYSPYPGR
ncbi:MAG: hypothetical protein ABIH49_02060 [archaeon]